MKKLRKRIKLKVEKTNTGYSAFAPDYDIYTTGENINELYSNALEAVNLCLEDSSTYVTQEAIQLEMELSQFFDHYRVLNARFLAERIGMNPALLSQYIRGKKSPSKKQVDKILTGIRQIGRELAELDFE